CAEALLTSRAKQATTPPQPIAAGDTIIESADGAAAEPGELGDLDDGVEGGDDADPKRRRARTMSRKQMAREHRKMRARGEVVELVEYWRPKSRTECLEMERPCLF